MNEPFYSMGRQLAWVIGNGWLNLDPLLGFWLLSKGVGAVSGMRETGDCSLLHLEGTLRIYRDLFLCVACGNSLITL